MYDLSVGRIARHATLALTCSAFFLTSSCGGGDGGGSAAPIQTAPPTITAPLAIAAPAISYGQSNYALTTGVPVTAVKAVNTGAAVATWSVAPPLPDGLTLSPNDGSIGGSPKSAGGPTTHTVRAENSAGAATATLTFSVDSGVLLDLGHAAPIRMLRYDGARILSVDTTGWMPSHWVLWNSQTTESLAQGDASCWICDPESPPVADLAGSVFALRTESGFETRATADGHLLASIAASPSWWKLAADGSYLAAGNQTALTVWSPSGTVLASRPGNYAGAAAFAAAGELRIARGPAGADKIETMLVPSGAITITPAFSGQFQSWFADGSRFLTLLGNTVWVYSKSATQDDIRVLPSVQNLAGYDSWFWTRDPQFLTLRIYSVGASAAPAATFQTSGSITVSGGTLMFGRDEIGIIDLDGSVLSITNHNPPRDCSAYAAISSSQWICGDNDGIVFDVSGAAAEYFGLGAALAIAGGSDRVAVATALGPIVLLNPKTQAEEGRIDFPAGKLAISDDGSVLAAAKRDTQKSLQQDLSLRIFSLPSAAVLATYPYTASSRPRPGDVWLSASGTRFGKTLVNPDGAGVYYYYRDVIPVNGSSVLWSDSVQSGQSKQCAVLTCTQDLPILFSPDPTLIAAANSFRYGGTVTNIYRNGSLVTAVPGWAAGWIDDNRLLVNSYDVRLLTYVGAKIVSSNGQTLATPPLPEILHVQRVTTDTIYSPDSNAIFSVTSGAMVWSSQTAARGKGAVSGGRVVFSSGAHIRAEPL
jgi:hypothetical protein